VAFFSRLTLTWRLTILTLLTLLPLLGLVIYSDINEQNSKRKSAYSEARVTAQEYGSALDSAARDIDSYLTAAAVVLGASEDPLASARTGTYLRSLKTRYQNFRALFLTDPQGTVLASDTGAGIGTNLADRPYIQALASGEETFWSGGLSGLESGELVVAYARTVKNPEGGLVGYLTVAFAPTRILSTLPPGFPEDGNIVLTDQDGQILASVSEPDLKPGEKYIDESPFVSAALAGEFSEFHDAHVPFDEGKRYGAAAPIPSMGWTIAFSRSQSALEAGLTNDLWVDIGLALAIVALTRLALIFMVRAVTRPLRTLSTAAAQVASGSQAVLPVPGSLTDPDVARLEKAFMTMAAEVREREYRLVDQARTLATLEQMGAWIASDLDFEKTLQAITDAGTRATEAQFGAFFYNVQRQGRDAEAEPFAVYAFSGDDGSTFEGFPMPGDTEVFAPTFRGEAPIRVDDITKDARYGNDRPHSASPEGHPPVRSYLAVPVYSATGETLGGLFFGHADAGVFTARHERLAVGIASWATIALDNARLYAEAQKVQDELRQSNQSKDEFLGVVSHELRTPVTTIYGGLRLLENRFVQLTEDDALELIGSMAEEGARLVRLIENLLAFARLELGRPIDTQPAAIAPLARQIVESFERQRPERRIDTSISDDLPPVTLEPTYFEQVLHNLLTNADKYSPLDQAIEVTVREEDGELRVTVSDHGPGVAQDEIDKIFDGFYRSDRTSKQASGHGLGLTVCKRLVDTQGGRIWARNLARGGFEVGFAFPTILVEELVPDGVATAS
jgi:signal transduction histidine kinase